MDLIEHSISNAFQRRRLVYFDDHRDTLEPTVELFEKRLFFLTEGYGAIGEIPDFLEHMQMKQNIPDLLVMDVAWDTPLRNLGLIKRADLTWTSKAEVGIRIVQGLRAADPTLANVPVLMCSEHTSVSGTDLEALRALGGPVEFLTKEQIDSEQDIETLKTVLSRLGITSPAVIFTGTDEFAETSEPDQYLRILNLLRDMLGLDEADVPALAGIIYGRMQPYSEMKRYIDESRDARERIELVFLCVGALAEIYSNDKLREVAHHGSIFGLPLVDVFLRGRMVDLIRLMSEIEFRLGGSIR
jgi:hypothetical protein